MVEFNAFLLENYANGQNTYMCGDYNLDLIKIHRVPFNENYFDNILSSGYIVLPTITLPTKLSDNIDIIFTSSLTHERPMGHICPMFFSCICYINITKKPILNSRTFFFR